MNVPFPEMEPYKEYLKSVKDLLEKSNTLQKSIEENAEKFKAAKAENIVLNKTCQDLKAALEMSTKENGLLNEECKKLKLSLNAATEKNSKLEKEYTASELSYSEVVNENANLKNSLNEVKNENVELNKKYHDLMSSYNDNQTKYEDIKEKWKLSNQIIKTLKKERKAARESLKNKMSEVLVTVFKPSTNPSTSSSENSLAQIILSSDDEDDLSRVVSTSQCDDKVNILPKPTLVEGSGKKEQVGDHQSGNRSISSNKQINRRPSPPTATNNFISHENKDINVLSLLSRKSNLTVSPNALSSIPSKTRVSSPAKESNRMPPSSVAGISNIRAIRAVSPRNDGQDFQRSSSTSILATENKSKTLFSTTKSKQESPPFPPSSSTNSPNKSNQTVTFSPTSPRRNNQSPIPSISALITTQSQFTDKPTSLISTDKDNDKNNQSSTPFLNVQRIPNPTSPIAPLRKDNIEVRGSLVSSLSTLNIQSKAKPTSPKDNERSARFSPVSVVSPYQNISNEGILSIPPKKDNLDEQGSSTSAVPVSEDQSKPKSVTLEEKGNSSFSVSVVDAQNNPTNTSPPLRRPVTVDDQYAACNKEQNRTSTADSQNNQNITSSPLRTQDNVSSNLPPSSRNKHADSTGLQSNFIMKDLSPNKNKTSVHEEKPNSSLSKESVCNEDSSSGVILKNDDEYGVLPSSNVDSVLKSSVSSSTLNIKFPVVCIPRIDEVHDELLRKVHPHESRKNKSTSVVNGGGSSKRRRSSAEGNVQLSKYSQRMIKQKTLYEYSCSKCSVQFGCNSDLNRHIFQKHRGCNKVILKK